MQELFLKIYLTYIKIKNFNKLIKQRDKTDCGAACLATVANIYKLNYPISRIRESAGTDQKGTSAYGLIKAAEKIGFQAKGVKAKLAILTKKLNLPVIAHVVKNDVLHFIVIYKIKGSRLIIFDPDNGLKIISKAAFEKKWTNILILLKPANLAYNKKETPKKFNFIKNIIRENKSLIFQIFLASIIYTILGILGSFYFKYLIDSILVNGLIKTLHIISIGVMLIAFLKIVMDGFRNHLTIYLSQQIDIRLIMDYIEHILQLPISFYEKRETGEIISRIQDSSKIREAISNAAISIMIDTLLIIGAGIILYLQSKYLFKIAAFLLPVYIILVILFANKHKRVRKQEMECGAKLQSSLVETINGINTIKASNYEEKSYLNNEYKFLDFIEKIFQASFLKNIQNSLDNLLASLGETIILWLGGYQVIQGKLTVGQLITFNALLVYFYNPLQNLIKLQPKIQEALVAIDRLREIMVLETKEYEKKLMKLNKIQGDIEFKNVDFIYNRKKKILNNISLKIKKGQKIAIVGASGSGKTTLIKSLLKFYSINRGKITIDGNNLEDIETKSLRNNIGYVPQDIFIFNKTIKENICLNNEDYSIKKIIRAAEKAVIYNYINQLPKRYDTILTKHGNNLSGGEKQRLAIARVLLKDPDLIILDEATNNLDFSNEKKIYEMLDEISFDKSVIIISHRLKAVKNCEKIFFLRKGKVVEYGSHQDLVDKRGYYYNLWNKQIY